MLMAERMTMQSMPTRACMCCFVNLAGRQKLNRTPPRVGVARRVLEGQYIGLFERGRDLLQTQKRYDEAVRLFTLATEVGGGTRRRFHYLAWAYGAKGDQKKSLKALQTAR